MSATDTHLTTATTYNGWANKATWLVNVYLYDCLYSDSTGWLNTYELDSLLAKSGCTRAKERLVYVVNELVSDNVREVLFDAIEQIDNGHDSMLRAMVCDFVNLSIYDVDSYAIATHIVEQYLEERE